VVAIALIAGLLGGSSTMVASAEPKSGWAAYKMDGEAYFPELLGGYPVYGLMGYQADGEGHEWFWSTSALYVTGAPGVTGLAACIDALSDWPRVSVGGAAWDTSHPDLAFLASKYLYSNLAGVAANDKAFAGAALGLIFHQSNLESDKSQVDRKVNWWSTGWYNQYGPNVATYWNAASSWKTNLLNEAAKYKGPYVWNSSVPGQPIVRSQTTTPTTAQISVYPPQNAGGWTPAGTTVTLTTTNTLFPTSSLPAGVTVSGDRKTATWVIDGTVQNTPAITLNLVPTSGASFSNSNRPSVSASTTLPATSLAIYDANSNSWDDWQRVVGGAAPETVSATWRDPLPPETQPSISSVANTKFIVVDGVTPVSTSDQIRVKCTGCVAGAAFSGSSGIYGPFTSAPTSGTPKGTAVGSATFSGNWNTAGDVTVSTVNYSLPGNLAPGIYAWGEVLTADAANGHLAATGVWPEADEVFYVVRKPTVALESLLTSENVGTGGPIVGAGTKPTLPTKPPVVLQGTKWSDTIWFSGLPSLSWLPNAYAASASVTSTIGRVPLVVDPVTGTPSCGDWASATVVSTRTEPLTNAGLKQMNVFTASNAGYCYSAKNVWTVTMGSYSWSGTENYGAPSQTVMVSAQPSVSSVANTKFIVVDGVTPVSTSDQIRVKCTGCVAGAAFAGSSGIYGPFTTAPTSGTPKGTAVGSATFSGNWNTAGDVTVSTVNYSLPGNLAPGIYVWGEIVFEGTGGVQLRADGAWPEADEVFYVVAEPVIELASLLTVDSGGAGGPVVGAGTQPTLPTELRIAAKGTQFSDTIWFSGLPVLSWLPNAYAASASVTSTIGRVPIIVDPATDTPSCGDWASAEVVATTTEPVTNAGLQRMNVFTASDAGFCYSAKNEWTVNMDSYSWSGMEDYGAVSQSVMVFEPVLGVASLLSDTDVPVRDDQGGFGVPVVAGPLPVLPGELRLSLEGLTLADAVWVDGVPSAAPASWAVAVSVSSRAGRVPVVVDPDTNTPSCGDWANVEILATVTDVPVTTPGVKHLNPIEDIETGFCYSHESVATVTLGGLSFSVTEPFGTLSQTVIVWAPTPGVASLLSATDVPDFDDASATFTAPVVADPLPASLRTVPMVVVEDLTLADAVWVWGEPSAAPAGWNVGVTVTSTAGRVPVVVDPVTNTPSCGDWANVEILATVTDVPVTSPGIKHLNPIAGIETGFCYSHESVATVSVGGVAYTVTEPFGTPSQTVMVWQPALGLLSYLSTDVPGRDASGVWDDPSLNTGVRPAPWPVATQLRLADDVVSDAVWTIGFPENPPAEWALTSTLTNSIGRVPVVVDPVTWIPSCDDWAAADIIETRTMDFTAAGLRRINPVQIEDGFCYSARNVYEITISDGITWSFTEDFGAVSQTVMVWSPLLSLKTAAFPGPVARTDEGVFVPPLTGAGVLPSSWPSVYEVIPPGDTISETIWMQGVPETSPVEWGASAEVTSVLGSVPVAFDENHAPYCPAWTDSDVTIVAKAEHVQITAAGLTRVNPYSETTNGFCYSYADTATLTIGGRTFEVREDYGTPSQTVMVWRPMSDMYVHVTSQSLIDGRSGNVGFPGQKLADSILPDGWPTDTDVPANTPISATVRSSAWVADPITTDDGPTCVGIDWSDTAVAKLVNETEDLPFTAAGLQGVGEFTSDSVARCYSFGFEGVVTVAGESITFSEPPGKAAQTVMTWPAPEINTGGSTVADKANTAWVVGLLICSGLVMLLFARRYALKEETL
jgi:hypothetical protein